MPNAKCQRYIKFKQLKRNMLLGHRDHVGRRRRLVFLSPSFESAIFLGNQIAGTQRMVDVGLCAECQRYVKVKQLERKVLLV